MKNTMHGLAATYNSLNKKSRVFLLLFLLASISSGVVFYISIYLSHIHQKINIIGLEVSAAILGNLFGAIIATKTLDKLNAFYISATALAAQGVCFVLISLSSSVFLLAIIIFLIGFNGYLFKISNEYIITSISGVDEDSQSKAITLLSVFSNIGLAFGGIIVNVFSGGRAELMFISIGIMLIGISLIYFKNSENICVVRKNNLDGKSETNILIYFLALLTVCFMGLIFAQYRIGFGVFLEHNFSEYKSSGIIALNSCILIFLLPAIRPHLLKLNPVIMMGIGGAFLGGGMYLLKFASSFVFVIALCVVWSIGEMLCSTISYLLCFQSANKKRRGQAMGRYKFLYAASTLAGALLGSMLLSRYSVTIAWELCGIFGFIIFIVSITSSYYKGFTGLSVKKHSP